MPTYHTQKSHSQFSQTSLAQLALIIHTDPLPGNHTQISLVHLPNTALPTFHAEICGNLRHKVLSISCTLTNAFEECSEF